MNSSLSIIIPCYNEGKTLTKTLDYFHNLPETCEVIVSDQSSDDTIKTLIKESYPSVNRFRSPGESRAETMNFGAQQAKNEILLFLHADTILPAGAVQTIKNLDRNIYSAGAFYKIFDSKHRALRVHVYFKNRLMKKFGRILGDNALFIRKDIFKKLGSYPSLKLFEDYKFAQIIKKYNKTHGKKTYYHHNPVITSARKFVHNGVIKTMIFMAKMRFLYWCNVPDEKLQTIYYKK